MATGQPLRIEVNSGDVVRRLFRLSARATEQRELRGLLGPLMRDSIRRTFVEEGVPAGLWRRVTRSGQSGISRKILHASGHCAGSPQALSALLSVGWARFRVALRQTSQNPGDPLSRLSTR
jgi:hypothetical protein